jgi:thioesterase domain-containing protein
MADTMMLSSTVERYDIKTQGAAASEPAPFFCVPGIGGNVLQLHALAQRMGTSHRLVALRTGFADGRSGPDTVEKLAARSVETVLRIQRRGPFLLGGYSGGAAVAFEMARLLTAQGYPLGLLALIDTRRPGWRLSAANAPSVAINFLYNLPGWVRDDLAKSSPRQALRDVRRHMRQLAGAGQPVERIIDLSRYPVELQDIMRREYEMLEAYQPLPWSGRMTLLRARTQPLLLLHDDEALGWSQLVRGGIDIITMPGNHLTMLREPNVGKLAVALRACFAAAGTREVLQPLSTRDEER